MGRRLLSREGWFGVAVAVPFKDGVLEKKFQLRPASYLHSYADLDYEVSS